MQFRNLDFGRGFLRGCWLGMVVIAAGVLAPAVWGSVEMPKIFGDGMVLQGGEETAFWGKADGGEVTVQFLGAAGDTLAEATGVVDGEGAWRVRLPQIPVGTRGSVRIAGSGGDETIIQDVMVGEVWLASGQSNMAWNVRGLPKADVELAKEEAANLDGEIRFFTIRGAGADEPGGDVGGQWIKVTPETVEPCSATAWNFARTLHSESGRPVGMVVGAVGGTPVEAWIPKAALDATTVADAVWARHEEELKKGEKGQAQFREAIAAWKAAGADPAKRPRPPYSAEHKNVPTRLFNGIISGVIPYTVRGVIWYQAEANRERPEEYRDLITALVTSWRAAWGNEMPFYYVELAGLSALQEEPVEGGLACIRDAQAAALMLPQTGVATAVDLGLADDIHPPFKREVGMRLARMALADVYDKVDGPARSPELKAFVVEGDTVRIELAHADGLRVRGTDGLKGFAIRGKSGPWVWAEATLDGETILVRSDDVTEPVAVRYAWASNPLLSVENAARLPLRGFRTDSDSPYQLDE